MLNQPDTSDAPGSLSDESENDVDPALEATATSLAEPTDVDDDDIPETVIEPTRGWRSLDPVELWSYRELVLALTHRDFVVRYKQSILGVAWGVVNPVMQLIVFNVVFGRFGGMASLVEGSYALFVFAGTAPWNFFSSAVNQAGNSLVNNRAFLTKVYVPRLLVPISSMGALLIDFAISFVLLLGLLIWMGASPTWTIALVPLFVLWTLLLAFGVGLFFASLIVEFRDFRIVLGYFTQLWMFVSPVIYPLSRVPGEYRLLYALNPMAGLIGGFRASLLGQPLPLDVIGVSLVTTAVALGLGLGYFRWVERRFADVI